MAHACGQGGSWGLGTWGQVHPKNQPAEIHEEAGAVTGTTREHEPHDVHLASCNAHSHSERWALLSPFYNWEN